MKKQPIYMYHTEAGWWELGGGRRKQKERKWKK
jgi:hypothetical protein